MFTATFVVKDKLNAKYDSRQVQIYIDNITSDNIHYGVSNFSQFVISSGYYHNQNAIADKATVLINSSKMHYCSVYIAPFLKNSVENAYAYIESSDIKFSLLKNADTNVIYSKEYKIKYLSSLDYAKILSKVFFVKLNQTCSVTIIDKTEKTNLYTNKILEKIIKQKEIEAFIAENRIDEIYLDCKDVHLNLHFAFSIPVAQYSSNFMKLPKNGKVVKHIPGLKYNPDTGKLSGIYLFTNPQVLSIEYDKFTLNITLKPKIVNIVEI